MFRGAAAKRQTAIPAQKDGAFRRGRLAAGRQVVLLISPLPQSGELETGSCEKRGVVGVELDPKAQPNLPRFSSHQRPADAAKPTLTASARVGILSPLIFRGRTISWTPRVLPWQRVVPETDNNLTFARHRCGACALQNPQNPQNLQILTQSVTD